MHKISFLIQTTNHWEIPDVTESSCSGEATALLPICFGFLLCQPRSETSHSNFFPFLIMLLCKPRSHGLSVKMIPLLSLFTLFYESNQTLHLGQSHVSVGGLYAMNGVQIVYSLDMLQDQLISFLI